MKLHELKNDINLIIPKIFSDFIDGKNIQVELIFEFDKYDFNMFGYELLKEQYYSGEFDIYAPNYIPIGHDGGEFYIIMKTENESHICFFVEDGDIATFNEENVESLAFNDLISGNIPKSITYECDEYNESNYDIILVNSDKLLLSEIAQIKKELNISCGITSFAQECKKGHVILKSNITKYAAEAEKSLLVSKINDVKICVSKSNK